MAFIQQENALTLEVGLLDALLLGQGMAFTHEQVEGLVEDRASGNARIVQRQREDACIDLMCQQLAEQLLGLQFAEDQLEPREAPAQRRQQPRQEVRGQGGDHAQGKRAGQGLGSALRDFADGGQTIQNGACARGDFGTDRGGLEFDGKRLISYTRLLALGLAASLTLAMLWLLAKTPLGLRMRALQSNRVLSALLGVRVKRVDTWAWVIAGVFAGITGLFMGNMVRLNPIVLTFLVIPAMAAAVVGRLMSLPA